MSSKDRSPTANPLCGEFVASPADSSAVRQTGVKLIPSAVASEWSNNRSPGRTRQRGFVHAGTPPQTQKVTDKHYRERRVANEATAAALESMIEEGPAA